MEIDEEEQQAALANKKLADDQQPREGESSDPFGKPVENIIRAPQAPAVSKVLADHSSSMQ